MTLAAAQDKQKEIAFFDGHAAVDTYDVFEPKSSARLIDAIVRLGKFKRGDRLADLGCGSGIFTDLLHKRGFRLTGLDISPKLIALGQQKHPGVEFLEGDVERLPFPDASIDGVVLCGIVHHLPDPSRCVAEAFRVLKPGGRFVAFDPNRANPFMWLYRVKASPFYSRIGVTENEQPVSAKAIAATFAGAGFRTGTEYPANLRYQYIASPRVRWLLPLYNAISGVMFAPGFMAPFRPFILTFGEKP